jgi:hypothetical protein
MMRQRATLLGAIALASMVSLASPQIARGAKHPDRYAAFDAMSLPDMNSVRVKLTYGGPQDYPVRSVGITVIGTSMRFNAFTPCLWSGFNYGNDRYYLDHFTTSRKILRQMIKNLGSIQAIRRGGADKDSLPYLSFSMFSSSRDTTQCFDTIVGAIRGHELFTTLLKAFEKDSALAGAVRSLGYECAFGPFEPVRQTRR